MPSVRQIFAKAGSIVSLPFLLLAVTVPSFSVSSLAKEETLPTFPRIRIQLHRSWLYDEKARQLTVRFVNRSTERFYRYSNVPAKVWKKLNALNQSGGVGSYLNDTVVQHPEKYPFSELRIQRFKTVPKNKRAGDSK